MKLSSFAYFARFGIRTVLFRKRDPILGTIILTDRCNLRCRHCSVNNIVAADYPYRQIAEEMDRLYAMGVRILFFCGGETFLWRDGEKSLRDLVKEAKAKGFLIVNVVTNGTFPLDLPEADLILLSLDGDRERHNAIRGDTYDTIMENVRRASSDNICFYMAVNQINRDAIRRVCLTARDTPNVRAVSFNFHTPYPDTRDLALSPEEKAECCRAISEMMDQGAPVFNLKSAFPYLIDNRFPTPCHQDLSEIYIRACLISGSMPNGREFPRRARQIFPGALGGFQENFAPYGGKRPAGVLRDVKQALRCAYEYFDGTDPHVADPLGQALCLPRGIRPGPVL